MFMSKFYILCILIFSLILASCSAVPRSCKITLKDGTVYENIEVIEVSDGYSFKKLGETENTILKRDDVLKVESLEKKIEYRTIKSPKNGKDIVTEVLVDGNKIKLFCISMTRSNNMNGINNISYSRHYYAIRENSEATINIGEYSPYNKLGEKLRTIFKDCPELLEKMDSKIFRVRSDVEKMFEYYNMSCE